MNISIAIADANREYLSRLVEGLQEYEELTVSVYTDAQHLENALQSKRFDIVLFDPDIDDDRIAFKNAKLWMCLYSEEARNSALYADCEKVIKYQRISKLYKEIIKAYSDKAGYVADFNNMQYTHVIAVYSPIGGCGKTTIAQALANRLFSVGKSVLFMGMEQLDSSSYLYPIAEEKDGITTLLEAAEEESGFELKLKYAARKEPSGMAFVDGFDRVVDYSTVSKEEMANVIDKIRKYGSYDVVIIDMNSAIDDISRAVFEQADKIIVVDKPGEIATRKMELFARQALVSEHLIKMCSISNFVENNAATNNPLNVTNVGTVHYYAGLPQSNLVQLIASKENINTNVIAK